MNQLLTTMKSYQYQIIQYVHDHFTGEHVNIGIVVYSPEDRYLACRITNKYQRITSMFSEANGNWIMKVLRNFELKLNQTSEKLSELFQPYDKIANVTSSIIPHDDTAIRFSEPQNGVDIDLDAALDDLFSSLVEKYIPDSKKAKEDGFDILLSETCEKPNNC